MLQKWIVRVTPVQGEPWTTVATANTARAALEGSKMSYQFHKGGYARQTEIVGLVGVDYEVEG